MSHPRASFSAERILRLKANQEAPAGFELIRLLGHVQEPRWDGSTSYDDVYIVAAREVREIEAGRVSP